MPSTSIPYSLPPGLPPPTLRPHPYQIYTPATYAPSNQGYYNPGQPSNAVPSTVTSTHAPKPTHTTIHQTYFVHHHHHHHHSSSSQNCPSIAPPASRWGLGRPLPRPASGLIQKYRPLVWLVLFLPLPPFLSVLYILVGQSLLRRALRDVHQWSPSLRSSANAAATGGTILALPLFILFYILMYPSVRLSPPTRSVRADFFDDDDDSSAPPSLTSRVVSCAAYAACAALLLGVGAMAAPLGVACLSQNGRHEMLSPARAAEAAIVGGGVLLGAILGGIMIGLCVYMLCAGSPGDVHESKE